MSEDFIFRVNRFCDDFYNCCAGNDDERISGIIFAAYQGLFHFGNSYYMKTTEKVCGEDVIFGISHHDHDDEDIKNLFIESCHDVIGPIDLLREFKLSNSQKIVSDICRQMRGRSKNIAFT